jgi:hypothetical protein
MNMTHFMYLRRAAPHLNVVAALLLSAMLLGHPFIAHAQTASSGNAGRSPRTLSYQGFITNGEKPLGDGIHPVTVTLYSDPTGTNIIWTGTYAPSVKDGVFNLELGSGESPLPEPATMDRALWVGVRVDNGQEMRPLSQLSASAYSVNVANNAITTSKLAEGAVTKDKIGTDYVGSISIDGQKVSAKGSDINFTSTDGMRFAFDPATNSVVMDAKQLGNGGKGANVQNDPNDWTIGGNVTPGICAFSRLGTTNGNNVDIITGNTTNIRLWNAGCFAQCMPDRMEVLDATGTSLFEVRNAGHVIANEVLGSCNAVEAGGTYNDNTLVGWGKVPAPMVNTIGPNPPNGLSGGVKGFGISCATPPVWIYNECLITLNVGTCATGPLLSDPIDDASITVTLVGDHGEEFPNPSVQPPTGGGQPMYMVPAFAIASRMGSQGGTLWFPGPLLPNQFVVRTFGLGVQAASCSECFGPIPYTMYDWPMPFYVKVTSRHD